MAERTALVNRVHAELTGLAPGYQQRIRSLTSRRPALELLIGDEDIRAAMVVESATTLTDMYGVGPVVAARFLAEVSTSPAIPTAILSASANGSTHPGLVRQNGAAPVQPGAGMGS